MVANKPGNLDGETAGSTVWTPPNELVVAAARARDAVAPSAERSALLKEKERQRSKRRRENATAEQRAKERARSARRRNALTPDEKRAQALKRAERRKERKANGTLPAPKRAHRAIAGSPERPLALAGAGEVDPATPGELGTFVEAVTAAAGAKATGAHIGKGLTADDDAGDLRAVVPQIASATERRTPKKASTEEQRAAERNRSKMRRAAMTDEQRKKESQARAERRRRSKALAAGGGGDGATAE
jgi:hypothetical protein